jgi:hypothetical protein
MQKARIVDLGTEVCEILNNDVIGSVPASRYVPDTTTAGHKLQRSATRTCHTGKWRYYHGHVDVGVLRNKIVVGRRGVPMLGSTKGPYLEDVYLPDNA